MIPLVTSEEMRKAESAYAQMGGDLTALMRRAGREIASRIAGGSGTLILAGPGNNGGDGIEAARILAERGDSVFVYSYRRDDAPEGVPAARFEDDQELSLLKRELRNATVVVDGLLGTGRRRPIEGPLAEIITTVNEATGVLRVAIDIPTGVDADTGAVDGAAFRAGITVTLGFGKQGLWGSPGADYVGAVEVVDIGLPRTIPVDCSCGLSTTDDIGTLLPKRSLDWNKGKSGTVLAVCGSYQFCGAPVLVSTAAYRAGAGLVRLAVPDAIHGLVAAHEVESVFASVASDRWFSPSSLTETETWLERAHAFALGPGLGGHPETVSFVRGLLNRLRSAGLPGVLDADGLNAVADWEGWWKEVPAKLVITPHPGEMARLLGSSVSDVQADRFEITRKAAQKWQVVVVLKGSNSIIAEPSGRLTVNPTGGPNLGTGGTGDVLTGVIASFMAQGMGPYEAATAGVWIHGAAGDLLRDEFGDAGTLASDLWDVLPPARKALQEAAAESLTS